MCSVSLNGFARSSRYNAESVTFNHEAEIDKLNYCCQQIQPRFCFEICLQGPQLVKISPICALLEIGWLDQRDRASVAIDGIKISVYCNYVSHVQRSHSDYIQVLSPDGMAGTSEDASDFSVIRKRIRSMSD